MSIWIVAVDRDGKRYEFESVSQCARALELDYYNVWTRLNSNNTTPRYRIYSEKARKLRRYKFYAMEEQT